MRKLQTACAFHSLNKVNVLIHNPSKSSFTNKTKHLCLPVIFSREKLPGKKGFRRVVVNEVPRTTTLPERLIFNKQRISWSNTG